MLPERRRRLGVGAVTEPERKLYKLVGAFRNTACDLIELTSRDEAAYEFVLEAIERGNALLLKTRKLLASAAPETDAK